MGITETCSRFVGGFVQAIGVRSSSSNPNIHIHNHHQAQESKRRRSDQSTMQAKALVTVFGMQDDGTIRKETARQVVASLGLLRAEEPAAFDLPGGDGDVAAADAALSGDSELLLRRAFEIFDENGNGFIEAVELKRVLECLGLDCGWGMDEVERMLRAVDVNLDGKVDFGEFELMMMGINCSTSH